MCQIPYLVEEFFTEPQSGNLQSLGATVIEKWNWKCLECIHLPEGSLKNPEYVREEYTPRETKHVRW